MTAVKEVKTQIIYTLYYAWKYFSGLTLLIYLHAAS